MMEAKEKKANRTGWRERYQSLHNNCNQSTFSLKTVQNRRCAVNSCLKTVLDRHYAVASKKFCPLVVPVGGAARHKHRANCPVGKFKRHPSIVKDFAVHRRRTRHQTHSNGCVSPRFQQKRTTTKKQRHQYCTISVCRSAPRRPLAPSLLGTMTGFVPRRKLGRARRALGPHTNGL